MSGKKGKVIGLEGALGAAFTEERLLATGKWCEAVLDFGRCRQRRRCQLTNNTTPRTIRTVPTMSARVTCSISFNKKWLRVSVTNGAAAVKGATTAAGMSCSAAKKLNTPSVEHSPENAKYHPTHRGILNKSRV